jgi:hypothetical protein
VSRQFRLGARLCVAIALLSSGCSRQDTRLQQHREKFESLGATTAAIADSWLTGSTSGTYALTALEQTFLLVEQQRAALAFSPDALLDPRGAQLSQAAESLSRLIAEMRQDVRAADAAGVRQEEARIPIRPPA